MTTALILIALFALATYATFAVVHGDRPMTAPRSHAIDPAFEPRSSLPATRWP
ncbi:hypothetical protein ACFVJS_26400 [Nocardioides sp. NPDC057772]|uniref:hypothetical protein n=1 Tax=Nocardioides sp. NPDC057772 TaxID=3346245 RepID=UPI003670C406